MKMVLIFALMVITCLVLVEARPTFLVAPVYYPVAVPYYYYPYYPYYG
jgi:hypothetical protein